MRCSPGSFQENVVEDGRGHADTQVFAYESQDGYNGDLRGVVPVETWLASRCPWMASAEQ